MEPADLARIATPSDPRLHPDGVRVAFVVARISLEEDRYRRTIWLWDGDRAGHFTHGPDDIAPRWSPDGSRLAFLRKGADPDDPAQVAVMAAGGGEATLVTDVPLGVEAIEWSPDGSRLVAVGVDWTEEWAELEEEERKRKPRRLDRIPYRFDGRGWVNDRRRHLYLVDPGGDEMARCLTPGDFEEEEPAWSPEGRAIACLSARHDRRGLEPGREVLEADAATGELRRVIPRGHWSAVSYRPDGVLHVVGQPDPWAHPSVQALWRLEPDRTLTDLTGHLDRSVSTLLPALQPAGPQWVGEDAITCLEDGGRIKVVRVEATGTVDLLVDGDRVVTGVSSSPDGAGMAFVSTNATDPGELFWWTPQGERAVTGLNEAFRRQVALIEPERFEVISDGVEIDVWAYLPEGDGPVPALLNIHGGPASQYGFGFFDEFQVYASAGYGVIACNPRGSSGRGEEFVRAVRTDGWGMVDLTDVTNALDAALRRYPRLDPGRVGVMGGSYGGFLTAWLIAHDQRYRSAVVERGLLSWPSFAGTSDIGTTFGRLYLDADLPGDVDRLWRASPISVAHRISTPTLILHAEGDFRCPIEQAEQLFAILVKEGVEAEFLRFPGEGHELSRSGQPRHRLERFEAVLDWHARHLASNPADMPR